MHVILQITGSLLLIVVCFVYLNQIKNNQSTLNPGTWLVLFFVMGINAFTYLIVVNGDILKTIIIFISFIMVGIITGYAFIQGKFVKIKKLDYFLIIVSAIVGALWLTTNDAKLANMLMQVVIFITFWPTISALWQGRIKEKQLSWNLAVVAYIIQIISLLIDFNGNYYQLCYPIVNGVIGNSLIPLVLLYKKRGSK